MWWGKRRGAYRTELNHCNNAGKEVIRRSVEWYPELCGRATRVESDEMRGLRAGGLGFDRLLVGFRRVCFGLESSSELEVLIKKSRSSELESVLTADRLIDFRPDLVDEVDGPFLFVRREEEEASIIWKSESESEVVLDLGVWVSAIVSSKSLSLSALTLALALSLGLRVGRTGLVAGDVRGDVVVISSS